MVLVRKFLSILGLPASLKCLLRTAVAPERYGSASLRKVIGNKSGIGLLESGGQGPTKALRRFERKGTK